LKNISWSRKKGRGGKLCVMLETGGSPTGNKVIQKKKKKKKKKEYMWTILHLGASLDWEIHQLDIKTTFLHGDLEEKSTWTSMKAAKNLERRLGMKLNKTLYGLKQAERGWMSSFTEKCSMCASNG